MQAEPRFVGPLHRGRLVGGVESRSQDIIGYSCDLPGGLIFPQPCREAIYDIDDGLAPGDRAQTLKSIKAEYRYEDRPLVSASRQPNNLQLKPIAATRLRRRHGRHSAETSLSTASAEIREKRHGIPQTTSAITTDTDESTVNISHLSQWSNRASPRRMLFRP
ncbi:MAG TPA: hypothetical protein VHV31_10965 [Nitrolancea sp.]|nr:hypothetical protein [Nitrolancea sp.]